MRHALSEQQQQQQQQRRRQRKQQLAELEKLKQIPQKMTQPKNKKRRTKSRDDSLYTGSVQQLVGTDGTNENCEMANNHGLSSEDIDFNEAAILAAAGTEAPSRLYCEDRGESDSMCMDRLSSETEQSEPTLPRQSQQNSSAETRRRAVKYQHRYKQLEQCQTRQHQRHIIIPKRVQLDCNAIQPQINSGRHCGQQHQVQDESQGQVDYDNNEENEDQSSVESDMIFPPTATITGSGNDDSEEECNFEVGNMSQKLRSTGLTHNQEACNQMLGECQDQSAITDEDGFSASDQPNGSSSAYDSRSRQEYSVELSPYALPPPPLPKALQQPPVSLTIDRQIVRLSSGPSQLSHQRRQSHKNADREIREDEETTVASLMRQLRHIEHCQRHKEIASQGGQKSKQMLCTSSSNCCSRRGSIGRGSGANSPDGSPESSLNLVSGTTILCRPGSLPGINIDGMVARRIRCAHENLKDGDDEPDPQKLLESRQSKSNKKTVSFFTNDTNAPPSQCLPVLEGNTQVNKFSVGKVTSQPGCSDPESDPIEYEAARRGSMPPPPPASNGNVAYTVEIPMIRSPVQQQPISAQQPLSSDEVMNTSASRQSLSNHSTAGSRQGDFNIDLTVGEVTVSERVDNSQRVASKFRLSADRDSVGNLGKDNELPESFYQDMEEVDLLPSDPNDGFADVELFSESNMTLISTNFDLPSTTTSTTTTTVAAVAASSEDSHQHCRHRQSSRRRQLSAVYDSLRQSFTKYSAKTSSRNNGSCTDSRSQHQHRAPQSLPPPHATGSNCANSSTGQLYVEAQHRRERRHHRISQREPQNQQYSSSIGYGTWNERRTGEAPLFQESTSPPTMTSTMTTREAPPNASAVTAAQASYVVFQHPPEVASAKQTMESRTLGVSGCQSFQGGSKCGQAISLGQSSLEGDCLHCSDDSLAFSWVSSLGNESNAVDLSISLDEASFKECAVMQRVRRNSSRSRWRKQKPEAGRLPAGEVTFQQLNTPEDQLAKLKPIVPVNANVMAGDAKKAAGFVKPSAVSDSAAQSSVAKTVFCPVTSDTSFSQDEDGHSVADLERNKKLKELMEERTDSGSASDQPFLMLEALSCGHEGLSCFGCYNRRKASWSSQQSPPQQLSPHNSSAEPTLTAPPPACPSRSASKPARISSLSSPASNADLDTGALRDLLATVFNDPSEGRALTQALMRGILCNVESLRSTLAAALVLLKNRQGCSGPLTQAIGTAETLDELIRRLQNSQRSHSRSRSMRKLRLQQQQLQQQVLFRTEIDCTTEEEDRSSSASVVVDAIQRCLNRRRQPHSRPVEHRCVPGASVSAVQCHAMSHYIIGEQFVEPSLEQRSSLECRPITTRVVLTETCKSVSQPSGSSRPLRK